MPHKPSSVMAAAADNKSDIRRSKSRNRSKVTNKGSVETVHDKWWERVSSRRNKKIPDVCVVDVASDKC